MKDSNSLIHIPILVTISLILGVYLGARLLPNSKPIINKVVVNSSGIASVVDLIEENYVDEISIDSIERVVIPEILSRLDPHSSYLEAEAMTRIENDIRGNFKGIGIEFNMYEDTLMVINVIKQSPAEKAGLLAGDRIVEINDTVFAGKKTKTTEITKRLKGEKGTKVKVGIKRNNLKTLIPFEIIRDEIPIHSITPVYMIDDEIGFIGITTFSQTTYSDFLKAVKKLKRQGMQKLVLDLRQNTGGIMGEAIDIADEFLEDDKVIVGTKGNARSYKKYKSSKYGTCKDIELAILIDSWSASASEILAGAMQDNDRGIIIGRRSFGKGLVQETFKYKDKAMITLTTARYYTPVGRCIQKPYNDGKEEYLTDIYRRLENGELTEKLKSDFPDSLKYITEGGKTVYGGGGITPDIFVKIDTTFYSDYYNQLTNRNLIYSFALKYADQNRILLSKFKTVDEILRHLKTQNVMSKFFAYAKNKGVKYDRAGFEKSQKTITTSLYFYIARNITNDDYVYRIRLEDDDELQVALKELRK